MRCYRADRPYAAKQKPAGYARRLPFKICEGALAFEDGVFDAFVKDFVGIRALVDRVGGLERGAALAALDVREARALADAPRDEAILACERFVVPVEAKEVSPRW